MRRCTPVIIMILMLIVSGCRHHYDPALVQLNHIAGSNPEKALQKLDSIDAGSLSTPDRHFYDFLTIKIADKNYRKHTSDSLILDVIANLPYNGDKNLKSEALYYGGRVYSDMGDYPRAIQYFQDALDMLPENADPDLRANMLSQTGRLLNKLRLNDEAASCLEKVIVIDRQLKDTVNLVYDLQLLGHINLNASNIATAEKYFKEALTYCHNLPSGHEAKTKMYIAETKRRTGRIDSALIYIRNVVNEVIPATRNLALSFSSKIYQDAGILDTAYIHAKQLVESKDDLNKQTGYYILLSPEIRPLSNSEEIDRYFNEYRHTIESIYDDNKNQLAINQITQYNYNTNQRQLIEVNQINRILRYILAGAIVSVLIITLLFLYKKNRLQKARLAIRLSKQTIEELSNELQKTKSIAEKYKNSLEKAKTAPDEQTTNPKQKLIDDILRQYESTKSSGITVPQSIIHSNLYNQLKTYIREKNSLIDENPLWADIKRLVEDCSPQFQSKINILANGKLSNAEFRTVLLIKCGFQTSEIAQLLSLSKQTIISRRDTFSVKVFGEKKGAKFINELIIIL